MGKRTVGKPASKGCGAVCALARCRNGGYVPVLHIWKKKSTGFGGNFSAIGSNCSALAKRNGRCRRLKITESTECHRKYRNRAICEALLRQCTEPEVTPCQIDNALCVFCLLRTFALTSWRHFGGLGAKKSAPIREYLCRLRPIAFSNKISVIAKGVIYRACGKISPIPR